MKFLPTRKNNKLAAALLFFTLMSLLGLTAAHPFLGQDKTKKKDDGPVWDTEIEEEFDYINAFLAGFRYRDTLPSAGNCTIYLEPTLLDYNTTRQNWKNETFTQNMTDEMYIFNTTEWISYQLAPSSRYCMTTVLEGYSWYLFKKTQFPTFGDLFQAWLQNLLGNVITFNQLYKKIDEANEAENDIEIYYWYGRFTTLFINFDPIVTEDIDLSDGFEDEFFSLDFAMSSFAKGFEQSQASMNALMASGKISRTSTVNPVGSKGPRVQGILGNTYGFTSGFVNASFGDASPNSTICRTNITRIYNYSLNFYDEIMEASEESLHQAAFSFENVLNSVHPITFSCYMSVFEYAAAGDYYMETFSDANKILYNLIHHLGNIYDTFFYLIKHQKSDPEGSEYDISNWWFKLGIYYGTAVYLVFYTPTSVDPYDPWDSYSGLDNTDEDDGFEKPFSQGQHFDNEDGESDVQFDFALMAF